MAKTGIDISSSRGAAEPSLDEARFPRASLDYLPSVVEVTGAEMRVDHVVTDWDKSPNLMTAGRILPTIEEVRSSLWLDATEMARIRESVYECHDLRVIRISETGEAKYLATRRLEPGSESNISVTSGESGERMLHQVPINGCWWAPGGRIRSPKEGSVLAERGFDQIDSVLLKLNEELGLSPSDVSAIHYLGRGETRFETEMEYRYEGCDEDGEKHGFSLPVEMPRMQHTINHNYVIVVGPDSRIEPRTLCSANWVTGADYERHRSQFLPYEQELIDAVFARLG